MRALYSKKALIAEHEDTIEGGNVYDKTIVSVMNKPRKHSKKILGWREWIALSELGISHIKAKVDTGARTSALHAFYAERFQSKGRDRVRFRVHPNQGRRNIEIECVTDVLEVREVRDSGGHLEARMVIQTPVTVGDQTWPIELTLTDRDIMKFRMLLGRTALRGKFIVDPGRSFIQGHPGFGEQRALRART